MDTVMDIPATDFIVQYLLDHGVPAHVQQEGAREVLKVQDTDGLWRTMPATFRAVRGYLGA